MMNIKTRLILIVALLGVGVVVLAVAFAQRGETPVPATTLPSATESSDTTDPTVTTPSDGATVEPGTSVAAPEPTPTLTREEEIVQELEQSGGQFVSPERDCAQILQTEEWCSIIEGAVRVTRPEWEELFPQTEFFMVKRVVRGGDPGDAQQHNLLIVEQNSHRYTTETFDRLLKANDVITVTDESRELVAKAFALMTIPDYLEEEVVFTKWEEVDMPQAAYPYNYCVDAWTKIEGLEATWCFVFRNGQLKVASGPFVQQTGVGDYIPVSPPGLLPHPLKDYRFRGE